jgi:4'-phosphopantetheinyl transferase
LPLAPDELRLVWCPQGPAPPRDRRGRVDRSLRAALAPAIGQAPSQLRFGREEKGRPFLLSAEPPDFNLSDTAGGTLVALCRRGRVGVDLERTDREPAVLRLAERYFAAAETAALAAMPADAARSAFLRLWTAKEASCKATGTGIFGWLPHWQFDATPEQPRLRAAPVDAGAPARWWHRRIAPAATHTAVIALRDGGEPRLTAYRLVLD